MIDKKLNFSVAGINIALVVDQRIKLPSLPEALKPFLSDESADFILHATPDKFSDSLEGENPCFETGRWCFYRLQNRLISKIHPHRVNTSSVYMEIIPHCSTGTIYIDSAFYQSGRYPLNTPMFEIVFTTLLARQGGLLAHASGVFHGQNSVLFMGSSGTGKTTSARLWERYTSASVLCDDRIAIRKMGDEFWAFGTPWHGEHPVVSPLGGRLDKILFLKHARENKAERMALSRSSAMLYARSFPPLWDKAGLDRWVDTSVRLAQEVPCYDFGFVPDASAVEYVQGLQ